MFHPQIAYKHNNTLDTAIIPIVILEDNFKFVKMVAMWYNIHYDQTIGHEEITIQKSDFHNWKEWKKDGTT